ncbi:hypothetical protein ACFYSI_13485 [Staphylococcus xylosus]|uniref:hypothetical protein n=1 Tax=Staphylococcus xylosus TaxID=1288 RepID=UPI003678B323
MYSAKYEEDKDYLVRKIVDSYELYKIELINTEEIMEEFNHYPLIDIDQDKFVSQGDSLVEHLEYVGRLSYILEGLAKKYKILINNINMLKHFTELTNEAFGIKKVGVDILIPLHENQLLNASLSLAFLSMKSLDMDIKDYMRYGEEIANNDLIYISDGSVYVDTNEIRQMEFDFRKKVTDVINYELGQLKTIESRFDSNAEDIELYLKYYLFYK